jgi:hypothetical protein
MKSQAASWMRVTLVAAAMLSSACSTLAPTGQATGCLPAAASIESRPGQKWLQSNAWRFPSRSDAEQAYVRLAKDSSPWPDWYVPYATELKPGTRFQMAIGGTQTELMPGKFGTFDDIRTIRDVRTKLAVRSDWKPAVDRAVTYEVIKPLPVLIGPIGPQVDPGTCRLLAGRWSQFAMQVEPNARMQYLRVLAVRPIR